MGTPISTLIISLHLFFLAIFATKGDDARALQANLGKMKDNGH